MAAIGAVRPLHVDDALARVPLAFPGNEWFLRSYWPENLPRVRRMLTDVARHCPPGSQVLDVGCGNGYISHALALMGFRVLATDMWEPPERAALFAESGITYQPCNFNELDPLPEGQFAAVLMGEVIEHILQCPLDLLKSAVNRLAPRGVLVVTTPNPLTMQNALRVIVGSYSNWGTREFIESPKLTNQGIIFAGDIHYREYNRAEIVWMVQQAGLSDVDHSYICPGVSPAMPPWKRLLHKSGVLGLVASHRLFGSGHYLLARHAGVGSAAR